MNSPMIVCNISIDIGNVTWNMKTLIRNVDLGDIGNLPNTQLFQTHTNQRWWEYHTRDIYTVNNERNETKTQQNTLNLDHTECEKNMWDKELPLPAAQT